MEVITSHIQADFDAFASMIAAKMLYPEALLVFPGAQEKNLRDYIARAPEEITDYIAKQKTIDLKEITRLIIVDTRQMSRIGDFSAIVGKKGVEVVIYDHHPPSDDDIRGESEHCVELGSNIALMLEVLKQKGLTPSPAQATIMAMGIYEDTGSLLFPSTRPEDCHALADLIRWGADLKDVSQAILRELIPEQVDVLDQLIKNAYILHVGGIDVLFTRSESAGYVEDFAMLVHKLRGMFEADAMFALGLMGERIYLVARSTLPQINAAEIAASFGGGGHATAAAASIKESTLDQAESKLVKLIKKETKPRITARDIMTFPVIAVSMNTTIDEASAVLNRYHINAALVQTKDGRVVGIITRQVVTRAQGHKLGESKITDYMIRDFKFVRSDAPVWEIRTLIIDGNQRLLPVVENRKAIGVITRTDLMRIMHEKMAKVEGIDQRPSQKKVLKGLMEERLPKELYDLLRQAGILASTLGFNIYLVGGIVRDMVLRIDNLDVDIVVEGDGIAFAKAFSQAHGARCAAHEKYKTAVITLPDNTQLDVATARLEYYKNPGGFPIVEQSTLKLDLYRRDFTINTMAICLNPARFGELLDFFGAQRDIKEQRIRVLHSLSFVEDPSRILRAVRFEQRFGFTLGKQTNSLVSSAVKSGLLRDIPGRRLSHEIRQMLSEEDPIKGMNRLREMGVLSAIHPDLLFNSAVKDYFGQIRETLLWFNMLYTHEVYRSWFIYLLALIDHMKPKKIIAICERLGLTSENIRRILSGKSMVNDILKDFVAAGQLRPSHAVQTLEKGRLEEILYAMSKTKSPEVKEMISTYITTWRYYKPPVTGRDLISIGFTKGKYLGDCLRMIRDKGLNGEIKDFKDAVAFAQTMLPADKILKTKQLTNKT
ncbi:MAG TPA: CBS domain-containing protein [Deltaproteobacteria bacterium]|nr:CBS domain-containing protein [Deltaproteobacteria bacterium]HPJ94038.1 CBS domain-containing protein [Deltaproteobacteria bacterium]HPR52310.1 CBS domain-containing protein [Deltaproteobacteria bacterium]